MRIRQSFCYPLYRPDGVDMLSLFREAKGIGYEAVECWFRGDEFPAFLDAAKGAGLVVASICGHRDLSCGLNDPAEHDRIEAELRESIDIAVANGIPGLICFSGNRREGFTDEQGLANCVAGLKRIAPYAESRGVNLNMELLNSRVNHPGYQCDRTAWGVAMCRQVGSERVKLLYDIYHMQIMEGDVIRTIRDHIEHIGHFHTAGNPGRHDLDGEQELNYPAICRAIAASGYGGYVAHEFTPKGPDKVAALKAAFAVCDQG